MHIFNLENYLIDRYEDVFSYPMLHDFSNSRRLDGSSTFHGNANCKYVLQRNRSLDDGRFGATLAEPSFLAARRLKKSVPARCPSG